MALADARTGSGEPPKVSLLYNPALRSVVYQVVTIVVIVGAVWYAWNNVVQNLARANMSAGFGFLNSRAGFDLELKCVSYRIVLDESVLLLVPEATARAIEVRKAEHGRGRAAV